MNIHTVASVDVTRVSSLISVLRRASSVNALQKWILCDETAAMYFKAARRTVSGTLTWHIENTVSRTPSSIASHSDNTLVSITFRIDCN